MGELPQVDRSERVELLASGLSEGHAHHAFAGRVGGPLYEAVGDRSVDQPDRAVMAEHEVLGDLAYRRPGRLRVPSDRQQ